MALKFIKKAETIAAPIATPVSDHSETIDEIGKINDQLQKINDEMEELTRPLREQIATLTGKQLEKAAGLGTKLNKMVDDLTAKVQEEDAITETQGDDILVIGSKTNAEKPLVLRGKKYQAEFSKMGNKRVITDMKMLPDILGEDTFWAKVKIDLKTLDDYANPEEKAAVTRELKTHRKFSKVEKKL